MKCLVWTMLRNYLILTRRNNYQLFFLFSTVDVDKNCLLNLISFFFFVKKFSFSRNFSTLLALCSFLCEKNVTCALVLFNSLHFILNDWKFALTKKKKKKKAIRIVTTLKELYGLKFTSTQVIFIDINFILARRLLRNTRTRRYFN